MAKILKPGTTIRDYIVVDLANKGGMAISYFAKTSSGNRVFLKQYKSPSVTVEWYKGYVRYQKDLKCVIEKTDAGQFCCRWLDSFEESYGSRTLFQVFEFVEGVDLEGILDKIRTRRNLIDWNQRLILAKVLMNGVAALDRAGIVHTDLKPANIRLLKDSTIKSGYQLKLIDMDFSVLTSKRAPWHGIQGYIGSPYYHSPEHLSGQTPSPASDVFTCGLMLYELLGQGHPYRSDDESYDDLVRNFAAPPPVLEGTVPPPATCEEISRLIHQCLDPQASQRPTAREINLVLNGRLSSELSIKSDEPSAPIPKEPADRPTHFLLETSASTTAKALPTIGRKLILTSSSGRSVSMLIKTSVGKDLCRQFGPESAYVDKHQFTLEPNSRYWHITPNVDATNQTLVNGKAVIGSHALTTGDVIAVGNESRGTSTMPLKVEISD